MLPTKGLLTILMCCHLLAFTQQASLPEDPYYTAGVVEFRPLISNTSTPLESLADNLQGYFDLIDSVAAASTDILIFPEGTLNNMDELTYVPDPAQELVIPCQDKDGYHDFLVQLSCKARTVRKYLVVNLYEKSNCLSHALDPRPCAANGLNAFNTNVAFDRNGAIISRYRKVNLFGEPRNTTYVPDVTYFDTDFGVRFGHFVCFDILFYTPSQELVEKHGVKDFLFPTMWFSQLPFLTSVQFHAAWSYANDVNFLAAGASYPAIGSTGTSIYNGRRGVLVAFMAQGGEGERRLFVSQVPKIGQTSQMLSYPAKLSSVTANQPLAMQNAVPSTDIQLKDIKLKRDYLELYDSVKLDIPNWGSGRSTSRMCYGNFCCKFDVSWRHVSAEEITEGALQYTYRLGVYDGWRKEADAHTNYLRNCALFTCIGDDIMSCGQSFAPDVLDRVQHQTAFERIVIEATYPNASQFLLLPNSLRDNLLPLAVNEFEWNVTLVDSQHLVRYTLNTTVKDLLAFSIYGNYFGGNETEIDDGRDAAPLLAMSWLLLLLLPVVLFSG